ncbi:MAG TPA: class I SAM-dependent rRNA methyltransferase [Methylomirabilota bacterium]|jgi:23S rRNA (cytosine1962-C5)-methyltransferase|nr:class I SAM-dependent rRNA methyltransferase [Methylomirabilota bacterium]
MAKLVLKPGADRRLRAGHPWIYRSEIGDLKGSWSAGGAVDVADSRGRYLGCGFYNPRPSLACRVLTRIDEPVDAAFFRRRLEAALAYRRSLSLSPEGRGQGLPDAYRLCWSEADGLPGLVVDRYGPVSVVQCLTLGMTHALGWTAEALESLLPDGAVYRLDDATAARLEGFEPVRSWLGAAGPGEIVVAEGDCRFRVTPGGGQKTGLYLDQRENRTLVAGFAAGRRVLDAFSYAGGFACHALKAGASAALLLDSSADALALAQLNLDLNGSSDRAELREGNAFDLLRDLDSRSERFGLVILDPPPFTRRKDSLEAAARGYKEINLRALRLLEAGGVLATFSCSHHITPARFEEICREAAGDSGVAVRLVAPLGQSRDHPVLLTVPETRYLTGLLLQALPDRR